MDAFLDHFLWQLFFNERELYYTVYAAGVEPQTTLGLLMLHTLDQRLMHLHCFSVMTPLFSMLYK